MREAYIAFGSNIGEPEKNVREAYEALSLVPGIKPDKLSKMYITKPWGYTDQPDFTNACCKVLTSLSPEALLGVCLGIEAAMGRVRTIKNGPRVIDIDLLMYEGEERNTAELVLPHPRMLERTFVLEPLSDLTSDGYVLGTDIAAALARLNGEQ